MIEENPTLRYALITGAAGGIGQALVKAFQSNGYSVIATDIVEQPQDLVCEHYLQLDLEKTVMEDQYGSEAFAQIREILTSNGLHVLINNAAVQILGGVETLDYKAWQQTLNVNLLAPFFWTQAFMPELQKSEEGSVINISSIHAQLTKKNFIAYATSKAALSGLTKALAVDAGDRIRINAIEPAAIETEMLKAGFEGKPELYKQLEECHPQQRIGKAEEVANLALAITHGGMQFLHGAVIGLDGGILGRLYDPD
jgi:NAD(P)-dependent dehydrogenase (short-subunit alcohol dehydrogenase family)